MAITTLAMVATVFVLNLYGMKEKPVPAWAKKLFVVYLARLLCMCNCASGTPPPSSPSHNNPDDVERHQLVAPRDRQLVTHQRSQTPANDDVIWRGRTPDQARRASHNPMTFVPGYEGFRKEPKKAEPKKVDYSKDWVHVAAVFDRLFFWLCLLFILVTTLILFHPITTSKYFKIPALDNSQ